MCIWLLANCWILDATFTITVHTEIRWLLIFHAVLSFLNLSCLKLSFMWSLLSKVIQLLFCLRLKTSFTRIVINFFLRYDKKGVLQDVFLRCTKSLSKINMLYQFDTTVRVIVVLTFSVPKTNSLLVSDRERLHTVLQSYNVWLGSCIMEPLMF